MKYKNNERGTMSVAEKKISSKPKIQIGTWEEFIKTFLSLLISLVIGLVLVVVTNIRANDGFFNMNVYINSGEVLSIVSSFSMIFIIEAILFSKSQWSVMQKIIGTVAALYVLVMMLLSYSMKFGSECIIKQDKVIMVCLFLVIIQIVLLVSVRLIYVNNINSTIAEKSKK